MLRPLYLDLLYFLIPLAVGALAFLAGRTFRRWPLVVRILAVLVALGIVTGGVLALARRLPFEVQPAVSWVGGATVILAWVALFLIGVVWGVPGRSFSSNFLVAIVAIAGVLVAIESAGPLWWRYGEPETWRRTADKDGFLVQSSGATCSPAASVMLLRLYDVAASEGELAYLSGTSLFGTDAHAMARALQQKVGPLGWRVEVRRTDYDSALRRKRPFVAHVEGSTSGHALLVEGMSPEKVIVRDPADGKLKQAARADFERMWDGTAIYIVREGE